MADDPRESPTSRFDTEVRAESERGIQEITGGEYVTSVYVEEALGLHPTTLRGYVTEQERGGQIRSVRRRHPDGSRTSTKVFDKGVFSSGASELPPPVARIRATVWRKADIDAAAAKKRAAEADGSPHD